MEVIRLSGDKVKVYRRGRKNSDTQSISEFLCLVNARVRQASRKE